MKGEDEERIRKYTERLLGVNVKIERKKRNVYGFRNVFTYETRGVRRRT